jgi:disulfide bond formation protein DsbB
MFLKPPPFRLVFGLIAGTCAALLAFGLYLQEVVGLNPCPMCIVQRYALIGVALLALLGSRLQRTGRMATVATVAALLTLLSGFGAFVAARQSWLQWYPPEIVTCGRDLYGMIENFPLQRVIPLVFKGSGDCTQVDWTFLGGSIANWSFVCFVALVLIGAAIFFKALRLRRLG